jgi:glycosyltransferase involved in cell wall biosynthesis
MRILVACEFYHPSVGGVQEVMRQLAERFVAGGHDVTVATSYLPERQERTVNGVDIVEFRVAGNAVRGLIGEVEAYRDYVRSNKFDIFMVKAAQQWTFDALWPVLDEIRPPKVFVPCGFSGLYEPSYASYFRDIPDVLAKFDQLLFYASDYRDINFARDHGLSKLTVLSNGASEREFGVAPDSGFRVRHGIPDDAFVVLTVGTFTGGLKGHRELALAFETASFGARAAVLILNGNAVSAGSALELSGRTSTPLVRRLRRIPRGAWRRLRQVSGRFRRLGHPEPTDRAPSIREIVQRINSIGPGKRAMIVDLPRPELVQAYFNSDLFVFASNVEYSPLVLFEAAAAGLPFLTVPVGNAAEIAEWTGAGVVCPAPQDDLGYTRVEPAVLAEHITRLAGNPARLKSLGRAGSRAWSERYTWATIANQYEDVFKRVIMEHEAARAAT